MHYKNGREAKIGDMVIGLDTSGNPVAGILVRANAQSTTCNGYILPTQAVHNTQLVTLGQTMHADDAIKAIDNSINPVPAEQPVAAAGSEVVKAAVPVSSNS
jgi:hypothetical protein